MIRNLPNAAGYSDSKGLFAARKAVMHYTQQKQIKGVGWKTSTSATASPS
jgi:alanine-synthesizing transaminase